MLDPHVEKHSTGGNYLRSSVFGGMDGMMTTFSVVTAVIGVMCVFETIGKFWCFGSVGIRCSQYDW